MMKLFLSLTLIWALSSTAGALQCQTCTNTQCSNTVSLTCPSETMCITAFFQGSSSGISLQRILKACAPSSLCPAPGPQTFSANFGVASALASAQCCNTDNCNSATLSSPGAQQPNSLQCFTCNPVTSLCNTSLQCRGVEDRCVQVNLTSGSTTTPFFGCASANLCASAADLLSQPSLQSLGNITSGPTCCGTSFCNVAAPTTSRLAMIHLLLGLFIFTLC